MPERRSQLPAAAAAPGVPHLWRRGRRRLRGSGPPQQQPARGHSSQREGGGARGSGQPVRALRPRHSRPPLPACGPCPTRPRPSCGVARVPQTAQSQRPHTRLNRCGRAGGRAHLLHRAPPALTLNPPAAASRPRPRREGQTPPPGRAGSPWSCGGGRAWGRGRWWRRGGPGRPPAGCQWWLPCAWPLQRSGGAGRGRGEKGVFVRRGKGGSRGRGAQGGRCQRGRRRPRCQPGSNHAMHQGGKDPASHARIQPRPALSAYCRYTALAYPHLHLVPRRRRQPPAPRARRKACRRGRAARPTSGQRSRSCACSCCHRCTAECGTYSRRWVEDGGWFGGWVVRSRPAGRRGEWVSAPVGAVSAAESWGGGAVGG